MWSKKVKQDAQINLDSVKTGWLRVLKYVRAGLTADLDGLQEEYPAPASPSPVIGVPVEVEATVPVPPPPPPSPVPAEVVAPPPAPASQAI